VCEVLMDEVLVNEVLMNEMLNVKTIQLIYMNHIPSEKSTAPLSLFSKSSSLILESIRLLGPTEVTNSPI
jgi:hypothetical protein